MSNSDNNSTAIEQSDQALVYRMASAIAEGETFDSLEAFASAHGLTLERAVSILTSPSFQQVVRQTGQAQAMLVFATEGIPKLVKIARSGKEAYAIQAIKVLGEMAGALKGKRELSVRLPLEALLQRTQTPALKAETPETPGGDIFDIEGL